MPPGMAGHTAGIGLPYDPDRARQLLDQAGYGDGKGVPRVDVLAFEAAGLRGNQLSAQWREALGVESSWEMLPWDAFLQRLEREPAQMVTLMWLADYPDPDNFLRICRQRTWRWWQNETYDQLVEKARQVMDPKERMDLYARAEHLLTEEVPVLPLAYERDHLLIKPWVRHYPTSAIRPAFWKEVVIR